MTGADTDSNGTGRVRLVRLLLVMRCTPTIRLLAFVGDYSTFAKVLIYLLYFRLFILRGSSEVFDFKTEGSKHQSSKSVEGCQLTVCLHAYCLRSFTRSTTWLFLFHQVTLALVPRAYEMVKVLFVAMYLFGVLGMLLYGGMISYQEPKLDGTLYVSDSFEALNFNDLTSAMLLLLQVRI